MKRGKYKRPRHFGGAFFACDNMGDHETSSPPTHIDLMKRCPGCRRDYYDDSLLYCLDDGTGLLEGPASMDESKTAVFPNPTGEAKPFPPFESADLQPVDPAGWQTGTQGIGSDSFSRLRSIAVLPFTNISSDPDNEYFCDGLAEQLLNALAKVGGLKVAARTSSFSFKGKDAEMSEIGRALQVGLVLEGGIQRSGERVRITVQLVNTESGYHLWSERFDRVMLDIFDIQDEITSAVVTSLKIKLLSPADSSQKPSSPEAYDAYLKGRYHANKQTNLALRKAENSFQMAITLDPEYALAYAALADTFVMQILHAGEPVAATINKARTAALRSIKIDEDLAEGHASLGFIKTLYEWDWAGSERELRRAIELNPSCSPAYQILGVRFCIAGRFDESHAAYRRAAELDPLSPSISEHLGWPYYYSRDYESAIHQFRKTLDLEPGFSNTHFRLGLAYFQAGKHEEAVNEFERAQVISNDRDAVAWLGYAAGCMGRIDDARAKLAELMQRSKTEYVPPYAFAIVHLGLGETEAAFTWLEKGARENDYWLVFVNVDPVLDCLRADPRFEELSKLVGLSA